MPFDSGTETPLIIAGARSLNLYWVMISHTDPHNSDGTAINKPGVRHGTPKYA
jgi:hypothetical protein